MAVSGEQCSRPSPHPSGPFCLLSFDSLVLFPRVAVDERRGLRVVVGDDGRSGHGVNGVVEGQRSVPDGPSCMVGAAAGLGDQARTAVEG